MGFACRQPGPKPGTQTKRQDHFLENEMELLSLQAVWAILAIIMIDLVLAGDNALVIGMAANRLPEPLRRRAIIWGTVGAVAIRFVSVAALTYLLMVPGLRLIGGLALIWIGWRLVQDHGDHAVRSANTFWAAIGTIVMADAVMGIDNALGIAAAAGGNLWLVIFGLLISVPIILFGAGMVTRILTRWPDSVFLGSAVLFLVACQMIVREPLLGWQTVAAPWSLVAVPLAMALVLTACQYYRTRILRPE